MKNIGGHHQLSFPSRNARKCFAHPLFFSTTCAMPFSQPLSFDNDPFSWGCTPLNEEIMNSTTTNSSSTSYLARCQYRTRSDRRCRLAVSGSAAPNYSCAGPSPRPGVLTCLQVQPKMLVANHFRRIRGLNIRHLYSCAPSQGRRQWPVHTSREPR